ncbi:MAG: glutamate mutase L, partial [Oscillospiraceae bacterium]|nr:glutamate mutase L [Oscillospiraceae bacterium]
GATTDVYSIANGYPMQEGTVMVGIPEPFEKRTVEGDLGLYHNLDVLTEIARGAGDPETSDIEYENTLSQLRAKRSVPGTDRQSKLQSALAKLAVKSAVERHAGSIERLLTPGGMTRRQRGKDLTGLKSVIGVGGPVSFSSDARFVLEGAAGNDPHAGTLKPESPKFYIDSKYILFAVGLLSLEQPQKALNIIKKYLKNV